MADEIKLCYFDSRGFAEVSRLILAHAGVKYEDFRWSREDWPKHKPEAPFGKAPFLVYKGKKIGQSHAISCFLAREYGYYGKTNWEAAVIDQVIGIYKDLIAAWGKVLYEQDETKKAELKKKLVEEDLPEHMNMFVKLLHDNGSNGFFVGNSITLADIYLYDCVFQLVKQSLGYDPCTIPEIKALCDKVAEDPKIKAYVATRKDTPM